MPELFSELAVIVPCYNVQDSCGDVINSLKQNGCTVIAVNDGANDRTGEILSQLGVTVLTHEINRGKGHALRTGFRYVLEEGDWQYAATVDADGQHDPAEIASMMEMVRDQKPDLLIGSRQFELAGMPFKRWFANKISSFLISKVLRSNVTDIQSGYRIYSREFLQSIFPKISASGFEIETELLILAVKHQAIIQEHPIQSIYDPQTNAKSNWRAIHDSIRIAKTVFRHLGE